MDRIIDEKWFGYQDGIDTFVKVISHDPLMVSLDNHTVSFEFDRIVITNCDRNIILDDYAFMHPPAGITDAIRSSHQVYLKLPSDQWYGYRIERSDTIERGVIVTGINNYAISMTDNVVMFLHFEDHVSYDRTTIMRWPGNYINIYEDDRGNQLTITISDRIVIDSRFSGHREIVTLLISDNSLDEIIISYPDDGDLMDTIITYYDEYYRLSNGSIVSKQDIYRMISDHFRPYQSVIQSYQGLPIRNPTTD